MSISEWNDKTETVKLNHPRALDINQKKRELQNDLLEVAEFLLQNDVEPYPDLVAHEYENLLLRRKQDAARLRQGALMAKGLRIVAEHELTVADMTLKELEQQKQNILHQKQGIWREAEEYGYEIGSSFTEDSALFKTLLREFVEEKSGCWIDDELAVKRQHNDGTKKGCSAR